MDVDALINKQQELMAEVPHDVRPDVIPKIICVVELINKALIYLNAQGHKPWRPNPLTDEEREKAFVGLRVAVIALICTERGVPAIEVRDKSKELMLSPTSTRTYISALGIIEETVEYLHSSEDTDQHKLEELTDILFFYLEQVILSGFTINEIDAEYYRKWKVNIERYRKAKDGDYSWDKRGAKEGL